MSARLLAAILCAVTAAACGGRDRAAQRYLERGDSYLSAGRDAAAVIEYRNAIRQKPAWSEAYRRLGDAFMTQGDSEEAYRAFANAIQLNPGDIHSQVEAGRLLYSAGRYNEALLRAENALERDNRNGDAQVLWGRILGKLGRYQEALSQLEETLDVDHRAEVYNALGEVMLAAGNQTGAEAAFRRAVARDPESVDAHLALAQFFSAVGNMREAELELTRTAAAHPANETAQRAAASYFLAAKRKNEAEPYLRASARVPKQTLRSTLALADFLITAGRFGDAKAVLLTADGGPMEPAAHVRLAALALREGSAAEARRILDAALKKHTTAEGLTLNAQLLQREGRKDAALAAARSAVEMDPHNATAQFVIGTIEVERGRYDDAERAFRAVLDEDRLVAPANLELARIKIATGRPADAVGFAEAAGDTLDARLTLARALVASRQNGRARAELERLQAGYPAAAEPRVLLGAIELEAGQIREARAQADRALAIAPRSADALVLAARAAVATQDTAAADQLLARAVAVDPTSFEANLMLARERAARGDLAGARTTIEAIAARRPDVAAIRTALGVVLEASNRPADARVRYEQALAIDPSEPIASNNLARLYSTDEARTTEALELARTAVARMPNDAAANDTLGWIAFKARQLTLARRSLERAVSLEPGNPVLQDHLTKVRQAIETEARVNAREAAERAKLLPDESKERQ